MFISFILFNTILLFLSNSACYQVILWHRENIITLLIKGKVAVSLGKILQK